MAAGRWALKECGIRQRGARGLLEEEERLASIVPSSQNPVCALRGGTVWEGLSFRAL